VAVVGERLDPLADAADVVGMPDPRRAGAELACERAEGFHRVPCSQLAEASVAVDRHGRAAAVRDVRLGGGIQPALADEARVGDQPADAMRVVPAQVGLHQRVGDDRGGSRRSARALQHLAGEMEQILRAVDPVRPLHPGRLLHSMWRNKVRPHGSNPIVPASPSHKPPPAKGSDPAQGLTPLTAGGASFSAAQRGSAVLL
jgi:hypothetical protein